MEYTTGSVVFNDWIITREIGQGATGKVFEIEKSGYGITVKSALKVIRIPKSPSDIQAVRNEGMTMASVEDYFREFVDEILREVRIMVSLKEHPNIVSYEDHCVVPHEVEVGWDVLIKMELLTPLSEWQGTHQMDEQTVIRLGKEISSALAYAAEHDLIHRDVKPENIFVNEAGKFKLGDFGIARTIEKTTGGLSKKGTESYMAPEVYHGNPYSRQVDIYSLGIVLYRFLNENRLPFYPPAPQVIKYSDRETAIIKRMGGMELPEPKNGSTEIKRIVQKACQYLPEKRYATMNELFNDLQQCNSTGNESKWKTYQKPAEQQPEIQKEEKNPPKQNQKEENRDAVVSRIQEEYAEPIIVDKQEALHTKKQKGISKKHGKFTAKKVLITCILAMVVSCGILFYMHAKNANWYYVKDDKQDIRVAVRLSPNENAEVRTWLTRGTQIYIEDNRQDWGYTTVNGVAGWVNMAYLSRMETSKLEEKHEYFIMAEIAARKEPSEDSEKVGTLSRKEIVWVKKRSGNWGCTEIDGQPCWFSLKYTKLVE